MASVYHYSLFAPWWWSVRSTPYLYICNTLLALMGWGGVLAGPVVVCVVRWLTDADLTNSCIRTMSNRTVCKAVK